MNNEIQHELLHAAYLRLLIGKLKMATRKEADDLKELIAALKEKPDAPKETTSLSKIIVSILVSIVTAVILFCATFVYQSNAKITEMGITLKYMSDTMGELKKKSDDAANQFLTRSDFDRAREARQAQLNDIETRIRVLEAKRK